jgi:hypothetical protein
MKIKTIILLEMCKAFGVPYAYPMPLDFTEEQDGDDEDCENEPERFSIQDAPYNTAPDAAEYLMNYQIFENERS